MIQLLIIIAIFVLVFFLQRKFYERFWDEDLDVRAKFLTPEIPEGEEGRLQIAIENRKKLPLAMLMVKFQTDRSLEFEKNKGSVTTDQFYHNDIFQVGSGEQVVRTLRFYGKKRGYYKINNIDLTASDLFFSTHFHASFQPDESLYVLPMPLASREFQFILQELNGELLTKRNLYEDPFELRGIREYQPYDDMRSINWKATAKTGQFMVNQRNYTAPKTVRIYMNLEDYNILKKPDSVEDCIRIGAGLVKNLLDQGIKVSFYCNSPDVQTGDPMMCSAQKGSNQLSAILRSLARLDTQKEALPFEKLFRKKILNDQENSYTCFISPNHYEDFLEILHDFSLQGRGFSWFCPAQERSNVQDVPYVLRQRIKFIRV